MTAIFHDMMGREVEDYVDDLVVKAKDFEDLIRVLERMFRRCRLYKLKMNPKKCAFRVSAGKFLRFIIHQRGIDINHLKVQSILATPPPTKMKELKGLLGKLSYIRRFIPGLAVLTSTFAPLLKKNVKYEWTKEHQAIYEKIQALKSV